MQTCPPIKRFTGYLNAYLFELRFFLGPKAMVSNVGGISHNSVEFLMRWLKHKISDFYPGNILFTESIFLSLI